MQKPGTCERREGEPDDAAHQRSAEDDGEGEKGGRGSCPVLEQMLRLDSQGRERQQSETGPDQCGRAAQGAVDSDRGGDQRR
jgi:hypothetical protein